jgi:phage recombination protein Bet
MSNELALVPPQAVSLGVEAPQWRVLKQIFFPDASDDMVVTVLSYCRAMGLDPMRRPFHIVKTWDSEKQELVEGIWPSVGYYRTTAARTGEFAGTDDTEFGPVSTFHGVTFPEWAHTTVYRMVQGNRCAFVGPKVFWLETYASKSGGKPNRMWAKRPYGQLAKCAEAAALRLAFPEVGADPTAEEMEAVGQPTVLELKALESGHEPAPRPERREEPKPASFVDPETGEITPLSDMAAEKILEKAKWVGSLLAGEPNGAQRGALWREHQPLMKRASQEIAKLIGEAAERADIDSVWSEYAGLVEQFPEPWRHALRERSMQALGEIEPTEEETV